MTTIIPLITASTVDDTVQCVVRDARGCIDTLSYIIPPSNNSSGNVYPNPTNDFVSIQFTIDTEKPVYLEIYDASGRLVKKLETLSAKKGLNEYLFSMSPLANGVYSVVLISNGEVLQKDKIIKQ